ncbi:DUF5050 domain-containing protein [Cohnella endophytica]|uniref:DUF5050 domain-containing protein n=1 Tax=Cohnella endophytica TaxID=2419778 RepID=A0A494XZJ8_9BACL|nr:DUF5050 domain-containing protein [Cohnella endophytica]RKP54469.1 DUF5050 domain-containing protein [Cohnella endophytica]
MKKRLQTAVLFLLTALIMIPQVTWAATAKSSSTQKVALVFASSQRQVLVGSQLNLKVSTQPKVNIAFSSSNNKIATVSPTGTVKGVAAGKVNITAKTNQAGYTGQSIITIEVLPKTALLPKLDERYIPATTDSNMAHGSYIQEDNEYRYEIKLGEYLSLGGPIERVKKSDPKSRIVLFKGHALSLSMKGDWLYFCNLDKEYSLYKIKNDGTNLTRLSGDYELATKFAIAGNWVYYGGRHGIRKVLTDGTKDQQVFDTDYMMSFELSDGWIYYMVYEDSDFKLYRAQLGQKKSQYITKLQFPEFYVANGYVYFSELGENESIVRIRADGSGLTKVLNGLVSYISDKGIYYVDYLSSDRGYSIYRAELDGSQPKKLFTIAENSFGGSIDPLIVGSSFYYRDDVQSAIYQVSLDGHHRVKLGSDRVDVTSVGQLVEAQRDGIPYVIPEDHISLHKYEEALIKAKQVIQEIIAPTMTDDQKLKAVHDYIVLNTAYDYDNYLNDTIPDDSYSEYGVLLKNTAVCQGYALTLKLFLDQLGIENYFVVGEANNGTTVGGHAWNVVAIDGRYYQVDTTWDDPVPNMPGYVRYTYYKVSDDFMSASRTWDRSQAPATN